MTTQTGSRQEQMLALLLNSTAGMSIDEMAAELSISRNAVRQHLIMLEKAQLVEEAALNITGGRPARSYTLTQQGINSFPKQYAWFCSLLLGELSTELGSEALEKMLWKLGVKLANSLAPQFADKKPDEKLVMLVKIMQELGYHATLEQQDSQPAIKAVNCVYHDLAQKQPELCQFDQALISTLLEKPVEQTACMAKSDCVCRFKIGSKPD